MRAFCDNFWCRLNFLIVFFFVCDPGTHSGAYRGVDRQLWNIVWVEGNWLEILKKISHKANTTWLLVIYFYIIFYFLIKCLKFLNYILNIVLNKFKFMMHNDQLLVDHFYPNIQIFLMKGWSMVLNSNFSVFLNHLKVFPTLIRKNPLLKVQKISDFSCWAPSLLVPTWKVYTDRLYAFRSPVYSSQDL